ncbi:hypothetical protein CEXT_91081 [Caerostris extrusa]|uniref:Uncharacterized protein n=1 Tax=Caerostris extrusa TaxID=172846 RepID=A0AAV4PMG0_CAEEX|nr:hypothetical protein CEXT_91081 [Caerostris extrusa]
MTIDATERWFPVPCCGKTNPVPRVFLGVGTRPSFPFWASSLIAKRARDDEDTISDNVDDDDDDDDVENDYVGLVNIDI